VPHHASFWRASAGRAPGAVWGRTDHAGGQEHQCSLSCTNSIWCDDKKLTRSNVQTSFSLVVWNVGRHPKTIRYGRWIKGTKRAQKTPPSASKGTLVFWFFFWFEATGVRSWNGIARDTAGLIVWHKPLLKAFLVKAARIRLPLPENAVD